MVGPLHDSLGQLTSSTDLVSAKGKTKEVYCCDIVVLISILMFLMREGLQCCISSAGLVTLKSNALQLLVTFTKK